MKQLRRLISCQKGIVLAGSLVIVAALVIAGVAARQMLQNDHRTVANLRHASQVFYLAASGVEWSKNELLSFAGLTPRPVDRSVNFSNGRFSVFFLSASILDPLSAQFVVRSLGASNSDTHALQAGLTKQYDLSDSAVGLRGNIQAINFNPTSLTLTGIDYDPASGQPSGLPGPRPAVTTNSQLVRDLVVAQATSLPAGSLQGEGGDDAVKLSSHLPLISLTQLADQLCAAVGAMTLSIPFASTLSLANQNWGSSAAPQLRCIDGASGAADAVALSGVSSGAGILIVRNADMILDGTLRWEGLIIVTGSDVSVRTGESSSTNIFGSMLINETGTPGPGAIGLEIQGSFRSAFSRSALRRAAGLIPTNQLNGLYASLPATIKQDYWRSISP